MRLAPESLFLYVDPSVHVMTLADGGQAKFFPHKVKESVLIGISCPLKEAISSPPDDLRI